MINAVTIFALLAASGDVRQQTVIDETVSINPGKIRTLDLPRREAPARVLCSYVVTAGGSGVRVLLMEVDESEAFFRDRPHRVLAGSPFARRGAFAHSIAPKGDYRIVLDNRMEARAPVSLHLSVALIHGAHATGPARAADPQRGRAAMLLSLAVFGLIAIPTLYALRGVFIPARRIR